MRKMWDNKKANLKFLILPNKLDKKAQIGETLTWLVATIVIIAILLIFIYISLLMAKAKELTFSKPNPGELKAPSKSGWIGLKNSMAFSLNNKNESKIRGWLDEGMVVPPLEDLEKVHIAEQEGEEPIKLK